MILVRQEIGEVLRDFRLQKGRTLRQVAGRASVALGYLSEVERGQKEASSEILASVADALDVPISTIMREVGDRISVLEGLQVFPDVVPDDLAALDLAEVPEGDTRAARDLTEGAALLQAEVAQDFADLLTNQDHVGPPPSVIPRSKNLVPGGQQYRTCWPR